MNDWRCKRANCPDIKHGMLPYYTKHGDGCWYFVGQVAAELPHYHITLGCGCEVKVPDGYGPDWLPMEHYCEQQWAGDEIAKAVSRLLP